MSAKLLFLVAAGCCVPFCARADDYTVRIHYTKAQARDVLRVYEKLSKHPVFMALDLDDALVTIDSAKEIPAAEAIELIRTTLLGRYGIELRQNEHGEALAGWSKDPKYPRRSDGPIKERKTDPKGQLRVIEP